MAKGTQHLIGRVRPPRVQITYDVEIGDAQVVKELPFVMGILSDLSGDSRDDLPKLKERAFIEISKGNFGEVMTSMHPSLRLRVDNMLPDKTGKFDIELKFNQIDDFRPERIITQVPALEQLNRHRVLLNDLLAKLNGNEELEEALSNVLSDEGVQKKLKEDLEKEGAQGMLEELFVGCNMSLKEEQWDASKQSLTEMLRQIVLIPAEERGSDIVAFTQRRVRNIDASLSNQLDAILHHPNFQELEGKWRGLYFLVKRTNTHKLLRLQILNISKEELLNDLEKAPDFDQSHLFKKIYEEEYGTFGGDPYSCLVGDYYFGRGPIDITLLREISKVAAAAHAPFITGTEPDMFDMKSFNKLNVPRDIATLFDSSEMARWRGFRETEDSRYVCMTLPRMMARVPYGPNFDPVKGVNYKESVVGTDDAKFCWANAAYGLAQRITYAAEQFGWTTAIRGVEGGGMLRNLPAYTYKTLDGDTILKCPTEVTITDRREKEISDQGFIALCHCKNTDRAVFFGAQTAQQPVVYDQVDATSNAQLSARITYILAASRFAHYIKCMVRDKIGSFMDRDEMFNYLNNWVTQYVLLNAEAPHAVKARFPLSEARIDVYDVPAQIGVYQAIIYLKPHFQLEGLTASIRMVANLPAEAEEAPEEDGGGEEEGGDEE